MKHFFLTLKFFFIAIFIFTAIGKLLDNRGFAEVLVTYQLFPMNIVLPLALAISLTELFVGISLLISFRIRLAVFSVLLFQGAYFVLAIVTNLRGLNLKNCGCFGIFLARPMTWWTVLEDFIMLVLAILFWRLSGIHEKNFFHVKK